jgi:Ser/Thr protein kinase RdoA (MazF antagonist)
MHQIPIDYALPALRVGIASGFEPVLAACGIDEPVHSVRAIRHHPGKRCTFEVRLTDRRVALKAFRRDPIVLAQRLHQLADLGLNHAQGPSITVLAGYSAAYCCLVTTWLEGATGEDLIRRGKEQRLAALVAAWSQAACAVAPGDLPHYDAAAMLDDLRRWLGDIQSADVGFGAQAASCIEILAATPAPTSAPGLIHGSFAHLHLIDLGNGPGVLDWDEPRFGPVALDLGGMLASLTRHALLYPQDAQAAFRASTAITNAAVDADSVIWFHKAALIKQAKHMCKLRRPDWQALARGLLAALP